MLIVDTGPLVAMLNAKDPWAPMTRCRSDFFAATD